MDPVRRDRFEPNHLSFDLSLRTGSVQRSSEHVSSQADMIQAKLIEPILFVRWQERCEATDVEEIKQHTERAHQEVGGSLVYIAIIPVDVPPPDAEARAALRDGIAHAVRMCASIHVVIGGEGLRRALIRSVSAGLLLASRQSFKVHADVRQALEQARRVVDFDVDTVFREARDVGLLAGT